MPPALPACRPYDPRTDENSLPQTVPYLLMPKVQLGVESISHPVVVLSRKRVTQRNSTPPPHIHNYSLYQIIRSSSSFLRFTCTSWHSLGGFIYTGSGKDLETERKLPKGSLALYKTTSYTRLAELLGEFKERDRRPPEDLVLRDLGAKS